MEEFIHKTNQATTVEELFLIYEEAMSQLGYDRVLLALMTDHPTLKKEAEHGVVKNYPAEWFSHYMEQGYDNIDPIRTAAFSRIGTYTWEEFIQSKQLSKIQRRMFNEAEEAQLHNGIAVSLRGAEGAIAAMGAASTVKNMERNPILLDTVNLLSNQFYVCYWRLMEKAPSNTIVKLTLKEKEILKWSAKGFTRAEIGSKLNITDNTVDYHTRNIYKKLDARNITSAVVKALNKGLIHI